MEASGNLGRFPSPYLVGDKRLDDELLKFLLLGGAAPRSIQQLDDWRQGLDQMKSENLMGDVYRKFGSESSDIALEMLEAGRDAADRMDSSGKLEMLKGVAKAKPDEACKLALKVDLEGIPYDYLMKTWLDSDAVAASSWLASAPASAPRTKLVEAMIQWLDAKGNTQESESWKAYLGK